MEYLLIEVVGFTFVLHVADHSQLRRSCLLKFVVDRLIDERSRQVYRDTFLMKLSPQIPSQFNHLRQSAPASLEDYLGGSQHNPSCSAVLPPTIPSPYCPSHFSSHYTRTFPSASVSDQSSVRRVSNTYIDNSEKKLLYQIQHVPLASVSEKVGGQYEEGFSPNNVSKSTIGQYADFLQGDIQLLPLTMPPLPAKVFHASVSCNTQQEDFLGEPGSLEIGSEDFPGEPASLEIGSEDFPGGPASLEIGSEDFPGGPASLEIGSEDFLLDEVHPSVLPKQMSHIKCEKSLDAQIAIPNSCLALATMRFNEPKTKVEKKTVFFHDVHTGDRVSLNASFTQLRGATTGVDSEWKRSNSLYLNSLELSSNNLKFVKALKLLHEDDEGDDVDSFNARIDDVLGPVDGRRPSSNMDSFSLSSLSVSLRMSIDPKVSRMSIVSRRSTMMSLVLRQSMLSGLGMDEDEDEDEDDGQQHNVNHHESHARYLPDVFGSKVDRRRKSIIESSSIFLSKVYGQEVVDVSLKDADQRKQHLNSFLSKPDRDFMWDNIEEDFDLHDQR